MKNSKVYLNAERKVTTRKKQVYLGNIIRLYSVDKDLVDKVKGVKLLEIGDNKKQVYVMSILEVIRRINVKYPDIEIDSIGEVDVIIEYIPEKGPNMVWEYAKMIFICFVLLFGSAFAIMTFHEDAAVSKIMDSIYRILTGKEAQGITLLEVGYSIGIGLGVILFFNNFSKRKDRYLPPPLEVEISKYSNDIASTVIDNSRNNAEEINVP